MAIFFCYQNRQQRVTALNFSDLESQSTRAKAIGVASFTEEKWWKMYIYFKAMACVTEIKNKKRLRMKSLTIF